MNPNKPVPGRNGIFSRAGGLIGKTIALGSLLAFLGVANPGRGAEPAFTEYQVKALFLLNFTRYVEWPAASFAETNTPIVIALYGEDKFGDELKKAVEGKLVSGRTIVIRPVEKDEDADKCHLLYLSISDKKRLGEILAKVKALPVLTVGQTDQFMEQGGMINFVKKEGRVRLEINLDAARLANLQISSKLLSVADVVKGKSK
jgi:hypothetical protein